MRTVRHPAVWDTAQSSKVQAVRGAPLRCYSAVLAAAPAGQPSSPVPGQSVHGYSSGVLAKKPDQFG